MGDVILFNLSVTWVWQLHWNGWVTIMKKSQPQLISLLPTASLSLMVVVTLSTVLRIGITHLSSQSAFQPTRETTFEKTSLSTRKSLR